MAHVYHGSGHCVPSVPVPSQIDTDNNYQTALTQLVPNMQEDRMPQKSIQEELENIYSYDIILSKSMLERGVSNIGDSEKLRAAVQKLVTGEMSTTCALILNK